MNSTIRGSLRAGRVRLALRHGATEFKIQRRGAQSNQTRSQRVGCTVPPIPATEAPGLRPFPTCITL